MERAIRQLIVLLLSQRARMPGIKFRHILHCHLYLFEMINVICQKNKGKDLPFGGILVVLVGDMFQLPPIVSDDGTYEYLKDGYGGIYFYNSHVIQNNLRNIKLFELNAIFKIYTDVVNHPLKQYQTENRTLTLKLSEQ